MGLGVRMMGTGPVCTDSDWGMGPRQPWMGSWNLRTSLAENGVWCVRASRTGVAERVTSTRAPGGRSTERRPSHHSTPWASVRFSTSTASLERGETTRGLANSAWALMGTITRASTSGHTTGPPAEKA